MARLCLVICSVYFDRKKTKSKKREVNFHVFCSSHSVRKWLDAETMDAFHLTKTFGSAGSNASGTCGSTGNFLEQMDNLWRYSTFPVPSGWNGNYHSICTEFPFLLLPLTSSAEKFGTEMEALFPHEKAFPFDTEYFWKLKLKM